MESKFVAPCCWGESLAVHRSPLAEKLHEEVGERIARGETEQAITQDLIARYGERILSEPRGGKRALLGIVPAVASLFGAFVLIAYLRRPAPSTTSAPQQYQEQAAMYLNREVES